MELGNNKKLIYFALILLTIVLGSASYYNKIVRSANCLPTDKQEQSAEQIKENVTEKDILFVGCNSFF